MKAMRNASPGLLSAGPLARPLAVPGLTPPRRGLCLLSAARGLLSGFTAAFPPTPRLDTRMLSTPSSPAPAPRQPWRRASPEAGKRVGPVAGRSRLSPEPSVPRFASTAPPEDSSSHAGAGSSPTAPAPDPETSLPEQLRAAMRLLTSPVVVCTSTHDAVPRAMTMSSLTSLSLAPTPLITFNVATPSRTLDAVAASRRFNVHLLTADAAGAAVARHFTRGNAGPGLFLAPEGSMAAAAGGDSGGGGDDEPPLLSGDGVLRVLRCRLFGDGPRGGLVPVRDHVVVVGEVLEMIPGKAATGTFGLAYADRSYRRPGGVIGGDG